MTDGSGKPPAGAEIVGWIILGVLVLVLAYTHEAAGECLRAAVVPADPNSIGSLLDRPSITDRVLIGVIAAGVLYAVLWGLHRAFHIFGRFWPGAFFVIAGAVLAGVIPLNLCHRL
jgi:hypothetical protein